MSPLKEIRDRRTAISKKLAALEAEIEALRADDVKWANAEEVLVSLNVDIDVSDMQATKRSKKVKSKPRQKPAGIPPMPEMIYAALEDAQSKGRVGLEPKEIRDFINNRWWPEVPLNAVGPIVWRLGTKDGKLDKDGEVYSLKPNATSARIADPLPLADANANRPVTTFSRKRYLVGHTILSEGNR